MPTPTLILTHPGSAHKDEFLACSVLLALHPVAIHRREPTPADLTSPDCFVIDVGLQHDPSLGNFDHHQLPADHPPTCSLSLVLQHLGLYEDAREFCEWLETAEWFDARGPIETAKWLGVKRSSLVKLNSPIDTTLLRRFALATTLEAGQPLWEIMLMIGSDLLTYLKAQRARMDFLKTHTQCWPLPEASPKAQILFLPRTDPLPDDPSQGLDRYIESQKLEHIIGLIYPDRRNTGYGLSRHQDNPLLDFSRIAHLPEVHFAHARGFIAKTSSTDVHHLRTLLIAAIPAPQSLT